MAASEIAKLEFKWTSLRLIFISVFVHVPLKKGKLTFLSELDAFLLHSLSSLCCNICTGTNIWVLHISAFLLQDHLGQAGWDPNTGLIASDCPALSPGLSCPCLVKAEQLWCISLVCFFLKTLNMCIHVKSNNTFSPGRHLCYFPHVACLEANSNLQRKHDFLLLLNFALSHLSGYATYFHNLLFSQLSLEQSPGVSAYKTQELLIKEITHILLGFNDCVVNVLMVTLLNLFFFCNTIATKDPGF